LQRYQKAQKIWVTNLQKRSRRNLMAQSKQAIGATPASRNCRKKATSKTHTQPNKRLAQCPPAETVAKKRHQKLIHNQTSDWRNARQPKLSQKSDIKNLYTTKQAIGAMPANRNCCKKATSKTQSVAKSRHRLQNCAQIQRKTHWHSFRIYFY
jgi:hypothetical protein